MSLYNYEEVTEQKKSGCNNTLNFSCMSELLDMLGYNIKNEKGEIDNEKIIAIAYDVYGFLTYDTKDTNGVIVFYGGMFH